MRYESLGTKQPDSSDIIYVFRFGVLPIGGSGSTFLTAYSINSFVKSDLRANITVDLIGTYQ